MLHTFNETCDNASTDNDLMIKQFLQMLKSAAFDWNTDLQPKSINNWGQMEQEFLNKFYNT